MKVLILSPAIEGVRNVVRDFMYGCWCGGRRIGGMQMPPLNLLYVATVLRQSGHQVELVDAALDYGAYERARERASEYGALVILTSTNSFGLDVTACQEVKRSNPAIKTILFGSHPTFMPDHCLAESAVDVIVRREPEFIIRDLVGELERGGDWRKVRGIGYRRDGKNVLNRYYPFIRNMDELPAPDRSLLPAGIDYFNPVVKRMPYTTLQTSRGCPAKCNFCTVPTFFGKRIRVRSADRVIDEFVTLAGLGYREVFIRDETFTVYRERNTEICQRLIDERVDLTWICNARVDMITSDQIALMKRAGCHMIKFGVESGNQRILDNIGKGITVEQTRAAFRACRDLGMDAHAHVMLGATGETRDTIEQTIDFVCSLEPTTASFGIFTPYPGTEVFSQVARDHPEIADGTDATMQLLHVTGFYNQYFTDLPTDELERSVRTAYRRFYFRPRYLARRLRSIDSGDELMRWVIAGTNIFSFGVRGNN